MRSKKNDDLYHSGFVVTKEKVVQGLRKSELSTTVVKKEAEKR